MFIRHEIIERNAFLLLVLTLVTIAIGGIVEVVPLFTIETTVEHVKGVRPYSPLEQRGRDIYVREGCYLCHSQQIRALRDEVERYGHYSLAAESMYDHPFQWGSKRIGPDLARVGGKYSSDWHYAHLKNPQSVVPESLMPHYAFLAETRRWRRRYLQARLRTLRTVGVPYTDDDIANAPADLAAQADPKADNSGAAEALSQGGDGAGQRPRRDRNGRAGGLPPGARHDGRFRRSRQRTAAAMSDAMSIMHWLISTTRSSPVFAVFLLIAGHHLLAGPQGPDRAQGPHPARRRPLRSVAVPTKIEKDIVTGRDTTGHEWDGLKELNTPLPKWWLYVLYATHRLRPWYGACCIRRCRASPVTSTACSAIRSAPRWTMKCAAVAAQRAGAMDKIKALSFADIRKDPQLMAAARYRRAHRLRQQLPAVPWRRRRRPARLSRRWPPAAGSGAARWRRSSRPSPTASAAAIPRRADARCRALASTAC